MNHSLYVSTFVDPNQYESTKDSVSAEIKDGPYASSLRVVIGNVTVRFDADCADTKDADMDALVTALEGACLLWRERKRSGPNGEEERSSEAPSASCAVPKVSMRPVTATDAAAAAFDRLGNAMLEPPCGC